MEISPELIDVINSIYTSLQGKSTLSLDEATLQTAYETFDKVIPLFTACSVGEITNSDGAVLSYNITGWADAANVTNVLIFGKLNVYRRLLGNSNPSESNNPVVQMGILSIPKDTKEVKLITINKSIINNTIRYEYTELINYTIENKMPIGNSYYNPNTLNLHLYIGDDINIKITQHSTYFINTKTKNITQHIYPPTAHGYGTTLMPMNGNHTIERIVDDFVSKYIQQSNNNQLFYDVL
jgi:hypothetical protein